MRTFERESSAVGGGGRVVAGTDTGAGAEIPPHATRAVIIGMSANAERAACLAAGMDDFLPKPFCVKDLLDCYTRVKNTPAIASIQ